MSETHQTRLRPYSERPNAPVSEPVQTTLDTDEDKSSDCDCDELPDGWPCANCYIAGNAEFGGEYA